jgi:hypothetical protein
MVPSRFRLAVLRDAVRRIAYATDGRSRTPYQKFADMSKKFDIFPGRPAGDDHDPDPVLRQAVEKRSS